MEAYVCSWDTLFPDSSFLEQEGFKMKEATLHWAPFQLSAELSLIRPITLHGLETILECNFVVPCSTCDVWICTDISNKCVWELSGFWIAQVSFTSVLELSGFSQSSPWGRWVRRREGGHLSGLQLRWECTLRFVQRRPLILQSFSFDLSRVRVHLILKLYLVESQTWRIFILKLEAGNVKVSVWENLELGIMIVGEAGFGP